MHKTKSQFPGKYILTSAPRNVYQSKQNHVFVYSWNYSYTHLAKYCQSLFCTALVGTIAISFLWFLPQSTSNQLAGFWLLS